MWSSAQVTSLVKNLLLFLVVLLPFHAVLISLVINQNTPQTTDYLLRSWKEIVLFFVVLLTLSEFIKQKAWKQKIVQIIGIYAVLHLLYAAVTWEGISSLLGIRNNLAFLALFVVGLVFSQKFGASYRQRVENLILWLGGIVAASVMLQIISPVEWFRFDLVGVGGDVRAIQDSSISRLHGVLSGPLQLASYLVLPIALGLVRLRGINRISYVFLLVLAVFLSYSRASLLAIILVAIILLGFNYKHQITKKRLVLTTVLALFFGGLLLYSALNYRPLSLLVFHAEPEKALSESSTVDHFEYSIEASEELIYDPLGDGPGAAGPASAFAGDPEITENYFLQVGLEVGIFGMALFIYINYRLARRFYEDQHVFLLASLAGLTLMNLLLHTWTDTATAWTWWFLAGIIFGSKLVRKQPQ